MTTSMAAEVDNDEATSTTLEIPSTESQDDAQAKPQPPYAVILHNDDINTFEFVIGVLRKVFNYGFLQAFKLTLKAHVSGRSIVWSGVLEVAELKADQIRSCGPDPIMKARGALALHVTVEPLPG